MKYLKLLVIFLILTLPFSLNAKVTVSIIGGSGGGGGASCPAEGSPDFDSDGSSESSVLDNETYSGTIWNTGTERIVCRVCWEFRDQGATLEGKTFYTRIWTLNGTALDSVITNGTSDGLAGSNSWDSMDWHCFEWSGSRPTLSASTDYVITLDMESEDGSNYPSQGYMNSDPADSVSDWNWYDEAAESYVRLTNWTDFQPSIRVYFYD